MSLLKAIDRLIKAGYPEGTAKKIATGELPMDSASRSARAKTQGHVNPQYHASMQDLIELEPGYNDGLIFTTPSSKFANEWLGKGKYQTRIGEPDAYERTKKQIDAIYKELGSPDYPSPEYDEFLARTDSIRMQERDAFKTIYPLLTKNEKTFDPEKDIKELEGLFSKERLDAPYSSDYPTFRDALKSGNYLLYENKEMVDYLKSKGYDSMFLRESTYSKEARNAPYTTLAHFNPSQIRSRSAAFDPDNVGKPNILGGAAPVAAGGVLAALGMAPEEAEAGALSKAVTKAINVRKDKAADLDYANLIISGDKKYETRNTDSLRPYVGQRMGIARTGEGKAKAIGEVDIGEPIVADEALFRQLQDQHLVPRGSAFDIQSGGTKYLYPVSNPTRYDQAKDVAHGIVARRILGGGLLGALGAGQSGQADASSGMMRRVSERIQANPNQGMIGPNAILEALMGFLAPQAMGDGTMDAYNRSRIR